MSLALNIVFDHPDFVVINKPEGVAVHWHQERTLLDDVREHFAREDIHPAHRLDLATSGLIIFSKSEFANRFFAEAFEQHNIAKIYVALTVGKPKKKQGWIVGDMAKGRNGSYKLLRSKQNPAKTYALSFGGEGIPRLWLLRPASGKTHQLRVALKSWGTAILGDVRYGSAAANQADRLYLHAFGLAFTYRGESFRFECLPTIGKEFDAIEARLEAVGDPWSHAWPKEFSLLAEP